MTERRGCPLLSEALKALPGSNSQVIGAVLCILMNINDNCPAFKICIK